MQKKFIKISINTLLILTCIFLQCCTNQESIVPQQEVQSTANDVIQKIKSLGFADNQIKEMPNYYLAGGDLYFSKKRAVKGTAPVKKLKQRIQGKYTTLTIHLDESLAGAIDDQWHNGIDQAIAEWNADEEVNFHFAITASTEANITILRDANLPSDVAIASEFPSDGRTGSSIRINDATTKIVEDTKQAFAHALEHCVGFLHSTSEKNKKVTWSGNTPGNARGPRFESELYAIQGDVLYRVDAETGEYYALKKGWAGTDVMGQMDGILYMVQFGTLYAVNPSTSGRTALTGGWEGSQYIAKINGGKLYIMQDSWIWPVDPSTGLWDGDIGSYTLARGMVGFLDVDNKYKLAVLRRKPGSQTVSLLYIIKPSNGSVLSQTTIPASGVAGWNSYFGLVKAVQLQVFNGTLNWIGNGEVVDSFDAWPNVELATASGNSIHVISSGTLYHIQPNGVYLTSRVGKKGDWIDTSHLIFLQ